MEKLRIMGDYCSSGLWNYKKSGMLEYEELNIPESLKKRTKEWVELWSSVNIREDNFYNRPLKTNREKRKRFYFSKNYKELEKELKILGKLYKKYLPKYKIITFSDRDFFLYNGNKNKHLRFI